MFGLDSIPRNPQTEQPEHLRCGCGSEWPWTWYQPRHRDGTPRWHGVWAAPKLNPCPHCVRTEESIEQQAVRGRMMSSMVPDPLLDTSLDAVVAQREDETVDAFRARIRNEQLTRNVLGVPIAQRAAFRAVRQWRPPQWMILHGPPGTGKTTVLAGLARRLLQQAPERREEREGWPVVIRTAQRLVQYHRVDDILAREAVKLRGLDESPTRDVARLGIRMITDGEHRVQHMDRRSVLLLDELGLDPRPKEAERRLVERVLCYRHDHGLCTVIATNRDLDELVGDGSIYGRRVGDRLRTALPVALTGDSWRSL